MERITFTKEYIEDVKTRLEEKLEKYFEENKVSGISSVLSSVVIHQRSRGLGLYGIVYFNAKNPKHQDEIIGVQEDPKFEAFLEELKLKYKLSYLSAPGYFYDERDEK